MAVSLSVQPYQALSRRERIAAVRALLNILRDSVTRMVISNPDRLTDDTPSIEKQVCALCSYTAYCNVLKDCSNKELQIKLQDEVVRALGSLIERIDA